MLTGVSSCGVVAPSFFERYTPLLMKARTDFPTHCLKVYSNGTKVLQGYRPFCGHCPRCIQTLSAAWSACPRLPCLPPPPLLCLALMAGPLPLIQCGRAAYAFLCASLELSAHHSA